MLLSYLTCGSYSTYSLSSALVRRPTIKSWNTQAAKGRPGRSFLRVSIHRAEQEKLLRDPRTAWSRWTRGGRKRDGSHELLCEPSGFHSRYQREALKSYGGLSRTLDLGLGLYPLHHSLCDVTGQCDINVTSSSAQEPLGPWELHTSVTPQRGPSQSGHEILGHVET